MRVIARVLSAAVLLGMAACVLAQGTIDFTSTPVTGALADAFAAGPDGSLWSVNQTANTINHVTFPDLHVSTFDVLTPNAGLAGIAAGPDGNMWFTESSGKKIGRVDAGGTITEFPIPTNAAPPQRIFLGPNGAIWSFNACIFSGCSRFIVTTPAGASTELPLQVPGTASFAPSNCTLGSDGNVWCIGSETIPSPFSSQFKVARISTTGGYTSFVPPRGFQGAAIVAASDGNVWYTWEEAGSATGVARVSPVGVITDFIIPTGKPQSWIFGLAVGADGDLYFADRQTSILYQLVLSTATDSGTATINSGTITIDIPEDIIAVSNQSEVAGIHTQALAHCPAVAFTVKSGGSGYGRIEWEKTVAPPKCTDLKARGYVYRYSELESRETGWARCFDVPTSPNPAEKVALTVILPYGSLVTPDIAVGSASGNCPVETTAIIQCTADLVSQNKSLFIRFGGVIISGPIIVKCSSITPEIFREDNTTELRIQSVPPLENPTDDITRRIGPH